MRMRAGALLGRQGLLRRAALRAQSRQLRHGDRAAQADVAQRHTGRDRARGVRTPREQSADARRRADVGQV